jgi:hypothetical protein
MDKLWKQITPSDFAWEREALAFLKDQLPDHEPYRAWANFEFIALDGSINEIAALVLTPKGLFLVEITSHPGEIGGDAGTWIWTREGRRRVFDNPRLLADRKAKKLKSLLVTQLPLRHLEMKLCFTGLPMSCWRFVVLVKRSFIVSVAKRELRDQWKGMSRSAEAGRPSAEDS